MSDDIAIKVANLTKSYRLYNSPVDRLKELFFPFAENYHHNFIALDNVSFEIKKGETVGIIGQNGSGKSTLLKIISGVLSPTFGNVLVNGKVSALLELGAGFNPEMTGIENIYFNGSIMGYSRKEMDSRLDSILAFAGIDEYASQCVKTYSSGMFVRLAFAMQSQVDPEILIVDEALSVGDVRFQAKCFNCLAELKKKGVTIIFVSHSTEQIVTHCTKAIMLDSGRKLMEGIPKDVVNSYMDLMFGKNTDSDCPNDGIIPLLKVDNLPFHLEGLSYDYDNFHNRAGYNSGEYRWGDGGAKLYDYVIMGDTNEYPAVFYCGAKIRVIISSQFIREIISPIFGIAIKNKEGITYYNTNSDRLSCSSLKTAYFRGDVETVCFEFLCNLFPGDYFISLGIASYGAGGDVVPHDRRYDAIHIYVESPMPPNYFGLYDFRLSMKSGADIFSTEV